MTAAAKKQGHSYLSPEWIAERINGSVMEGVYGRRHVQANILA